MARRIVSALALLVACSPVWAQLGPVQHVQVGSLGLGTLVSDAVPPRFDIPFTAQPGLPPVLVLRPQGANRRWDSMPGHTKTWQRLAGTDGEQVDDIASAAGYRIRAIRPARCTASISQCGP